MTNDKTAFNMKTATCFSLLFLPLFLAAQAKVRRETSHYAEASGWRPQARIERSFNELGLETSQAYFIYDQGAWKMTNRQLKVYDENGNQTHFSVYQLRADSTALYLESEEKKLVDPNTGCILTSTWKSYDELGSLENTSTDQYFYGPNCRKDSTWSEYCFPLDELWLCTNQYETFEYDANGNRTVVHVGLVDLFTGEVTHNDSMIVWVYDASDRLIERRLNSDGGIDSKTIYEYNADGTLSSESEYLQHDSVLTLAYYAIYTYDYDLQGFLVEKTESTYYPASNSAYTDVRRYNNYCDGLPKYEFVGDYARITYEYEEGVDCGTDWSGIEPAIAPNPTDGLFTVRWPKMERGKAHVSLHNATGGEVSGYRVNFRTDAVEMDVSSLPPGIYFLQITEGKQRFGKKVMVY